MPTRCAVHQPNLFPRPHTLAKLLAADVWIVLDDVQFTRHDYQHRARLADLHNPALQQWLTLPVHLPNGRATLIRDLELAEPARSRRIMLRLIQQYYGRSPHWSAVRETVDEVLSAFENTTSAAAIAETSTRVLLRLLRWTGTIHHSSLLPARAGRSERLADLTAAVGATHYLCGPGGARYLDLRAFHDWDLAVEYHNVACDPPHRAITVLRQLAQVGPSSLNEHLRAVRR
jgi:hypothetical protein